MVTTAPVAPRQHAGRGLKLDHRSRETPPPHVAPRQHAGRGLKLRMRRCGWMMAGCRPAPTRGARIETIKKALPPLNVVVAPRQHAGRGLKLYWQEHLAGNLQSPRANTRGAD